MPATYFIGGLLCGVLVTVAFCFPAVGRAIARIVSVILMGGGVGMIAWAGFLIQRQGEDEMRPWPANMDWNLVSEESEAFAWGIGFVVAGVTALVLSFIYRRNRIAPPQL